MNSLKNTVVIVLLLGVSYGVFQLVNAPEPNVSKEKEPEEIEIIDDDPGTELTGIDQMPSQPSEEAFGNPMAQGGSQSKQLPPPLLDQDQPKTEPNYPNGLAGSEIPSQPDLNLPDNSSPGDLVGPEGPAFSGPLDQNNLSAPGGTNQQGQFATQNDLQMVPQKQSTQNLLGNNSSGFQNTQPIEQTQTPPNPQELQNAWPRVRQMVTQRNFSGALKELSRFYHADLNQGQRVELLNWLDSLAGKVIYSNGFHLNGQPYVVQNGESLRSLSQKWQVPERLIYKINESVITNPDFLIAGTQLKMIQGPFRAEIAYGKKEMTMFVGGMYAGRFPLDFGNDKPITVGEYSVQRKSDRGQVYTDRSGQSVAAGSQYNPYGKYWIDLGNGLCIHSANTNDGRGCIRVQYNEVANVLDAADVFGILSEKSQVSIRR